MLILSVIYAILAFITTYYIFKNKVKLYAMIVPIFICLIIIWANLLSNIGIFGLGGIIYFICLFIKKRI